MLDRNDHNFSKKQNRNSKATTTQSFAWRPYFFMRTSAALAWPSILSARLMRAETAPIIAEASFVARWKVTIFKNLWTERPPVYFDAPMVGRVWLGPDALSPCVTVTSSPRK